MKNVEWGEYKLGDLFDKLELNFNKSTFDKKNDISKIKTSEFSLPLVNAKNGNNGIMYYGRPEDFESDKMTLDIVNDGAVSTGNCYPQPQKTGVLYNAYLIKAKIKINREHLFFLAVAVQKSIKTKFGYEYKASWNRVKNEYIKLPIKNNEIDFDFMESFIAELEAERVAELEAERVAELTAYLKVSGLDNYKLSTNESKALDDFESLKWKEYSLDNLFDVLSSKKKFDANKTCIKENEGCPYVVRTASNNGLKGYINEDKKFLNDGNTISFGQDTATMFYQEKPYFTGDKIKILKPKICQFNKNNAHFLLSTMKKTFSSFTWGGTSFSSNKIKSQTIFLPTENESIDFDFMETFISAIKKLVIKDVVLYADKKISATKDIIRQK